MHQVRDTVSSSRSTGWSRTCRNRSPSTSTLGRSRSSQRGSHQAGEPSNVITAGTMVIRTTNASNATAMASAKPIGLMRSSPEKMNPDEDADHDDCGRGDDAGAVPEAGDHRRRGRLRRARASSRMRVTRKTW